MNAIIPHIIILMVAYPVQRTSSIQFTFFKGYGFTCILGIVLGRTAIGKKLFKYIKHFLENRISGTKRLIALAYIPFLLSLGVLVVFLIMRQNEWSNPLYVLSYIAMTVLFFVSNQWAEATLKIVQERKK